MSGSSGWCLFCNLIVISIWLWEDSHNEFTYTTILTKGKNNSLWFRALPFILIKVVFPLMWFCWEGGCALIALPDESCAPAALRSCHVACWSQGVIPKHMALLGRAPSPWNQAGDSPSIMYCGPVLGVRLLGVWVMFRVILCLSWLIGCVHSCICGAVL